MTNIDEFIANIQDCQSLINRILCLYADSATDRQDLRQEILSQAWAAYSNFRGHSKFSTWLYRICFNVAITRLKKEKRYVTGNDVPEAMEQGLGLDKELLDQIMTVLNDVEKSIVLLLIDGYDREEMTSVLGITSQNLRVKIHRIRTKLEQSNINDFIEWGAHNAR